MKVQTIPKEDAIAFANEIFKESFLTYLEFDLYFKEMKSGIYRSSWIDEPLYIHGEYVYIYLEEQGITRASKLKIPAILVKQHKYQVVYSFESIYYAIYYDGDKLQVCEYHDFLTTLKKDLILIEQKEFV